ncbi:MAG TPA: proline dehydrogenase family protein, partial [Aggregatilineales bacterium]|nr:proline dehydrogenase family protein [Aggregatilineales bacterium]
RARECHNFVRIDMESSEYVDRTLAIYRTLRGQYGYPNIGVVIQSYLRRSEVDMRALAAEGANVRLCKGAYKEPPDIAFPAKADVDQNYIRLMQVFLSDDARTHGAYLGAATHDEKMIQATRDFAAAHGIDRQAFEFQMLYGVRPQRQDQLAAEGYKMQVYVPYGTEWYPYFMRRLAERPANVWFIVRNFFRA